MVHVSYRILLYNIIVKLLSYVSFCPFCVHIYDMCCILGTAMSCVLVCKLVHVHYRTSKSDSALRALAGSFAPPRTEKTRTASGPPMLSDDMSTPTVEPEVCSK